MFENKSKNKGFGIVEVIVAVGIFIIISAASVSSILGTFSLSRIGDEETNAKVFAQEGIDAVRSIKNQSWTLIVPGTYGVDKSTGKWTFSGASNTSGKFTRQITISATYRDSNGNIVSSGGTLDPDTMKVVSLVNWNFSPNRSNSVSMTTYLGHWEMSIPTPSPSVTPSPTPVPNSCPTYCQTLSYSGGNCRQNSSQCSSSGEVYQSGGDVFCTANPNRRCCCIPIPTPTPVPTIPPGNCNEFCQSTYGRPGSCVKKNLCGGTDAGRIYECTNPNVCCCQ